VRGRTDSLAAQPIALPILNCGANDSDEGDVVRTAQARAIILHPDQQQRLRTHGKGTQTGVILRQKPIGVLQHSGGISSGIDALRNRPIR